MSLDVRGCRHRAAGNLLFLLTLRLLLYQSTAFARSFIYPAALHGRRAVLLSARGLLTQIAPSLWHSYPRRVLLCVLLSTGIRVRETNELEHDMWHTVTQTRTLGLLDSISVPLGGTERRLTSNLLGVVRTTSFFFSRTDSKLALGLLLKI